MRHISMVFVIAFCICIFVLPIYIAFSTVNKQNTDSTTIAQSIKEKDCDLVESTAHPKNNLSLTSIEEIPIEQINYQLVKQVQAWSDYADAANPDVVYRYTMTYLDDDIIETVLLRLAKERSLSTEDYQQLRQTTFGQLQSNDELSFLMTVAASNPNSAMALEIPVENMKLVDTYGQSVNAKRWDRMFDNKLYVANQPQFGHIIFPAYERSADGRTCYESIDFSRDTSMTIEADKMVIGSTKSDFFWSIKLSPIGQQIAENLPTPEPQTAQQAGIYSSDFMQSQIPTPVYGQAPSPEFWLDLASFVFDVIVFLLAL